MKYKAILLACLPFILLTGLLASCQTKDVHNNSDQPIPTEEAKPTRLPGMNTGEGECDEPEQLEYYGWVSAHAADAFIWAQIVALHPTLSPSVVSTGTAELPSGTRVEICDGILTPALTLEVEVLRSLGGRLQPGERIMAAVGSFQLNAWEPYPRWIQEEDQWTLCWYDLETPVPLQQDRVPLQPGTKVGLTLNYVEEENLWTLNRYLMFTMVESVNDLQVIHYQEIRSHCTPTYPEDLEGMTLDEVESYLHQSHPDLADRVASQREVDQRIIHSLCPKSYVAGSCIPAGARPAPEPPDEGEGSYEYE